MAASMLKTNNLKKSLKLLTRSVRLVSELSVVLDKDVAPLQFQFEW